jgi:hypothetical protein
MRLYATGRLAFFFGWLLCCNAFCSGSKLIIDGNPLQTIAGWGFTTAPLDWDSQCQLRSTDAIVRLLRNSGASVVRVVVGDSKLYQEARHDLDRDEMQTELAPQFDAIRVSGLRHYTIAIHGPPKSMKTYFSDEGEVHFDPNYLRAERQQDYVDYIAAILEYATKRVGWEADAVTFATRPDLNEGCAYRPAQWQEIVKMTRITLDRHGLSTIAILGPETSTLSGLEMLLGPAQSSGSQEPVWRVLGGVDVASERFIDAFSDNGLAVARELLPYRSGNGGFWLIDASPTSRESEGVLPREFSHLGRELVAFGFQHWLWKYGYSNAARPDSLYWGPDLKLSPMGRALTKLWRVAPVGSTVHRVHINAQERDVDAFALEWKSRVVIAISNGTESSNSLTLVLADRQRWRMSLFWDSGAVEDQPLEPELGKFSVVLPGESVAIVESRD